MKMEVVLVLQCMRCDWLLNEGRLIVNEKYKNQKCGWDGKWASSGWHTYGKEQKSERAHGTEKEGRGGRVGEKATVKAARMVAQ